MVVNASQLERNADTTAKLLQLTLHIGLNLVQTFHLLIISVEVMLVNLMNKHFIGNAWLHLVGCNDQVTEAHAGVFVVLCLRVNHIHEGAAIPNQS